MSPCDSCGRWYNNITVHQGYDFCWSCLGVLPESLKRARRKWRVILVFLILALAIIVGCLSFSAYITRGWLW